MDTPLRSNSNEITVSPKRNKNVRKFPLSVEEEEEAKASNIKLKRHYGAHGREWNH